MKLTELIETLNKLQAEHGDREVFFYDSLEEHTSDIKGSVWTGNATGADYKFYNKGDSDIQLSDIGMDAPVMVLR